MYNTGIYEVFETSILDNIDGVISPVSEMLRPERAFLNGICRKEKPRNILEVGVSSGASSAVMLNATEEFQSQIYSIDLLHEFYNDTNKDIGFIVDSFPNLKINYHLYKGGYAYTFLNQINKKFDMCLLDTSHTNPGEILDFLQVLPYLNKNAMLILHDISLYSLIPIYQPISSIYTAMIPFVTTCAILFATLRGKKFLHDTDLTVQSNIGAIELDTNPCDYLDEFFHLLSMPWYHYELSEETIDGLSEFLKHAYGKKYSDIFLKIVDFQKNEKVKPIIQRMIQFHQQEYAKSNNAPTESSYK